MRRAVVLRQMGGAAISQERVLGQKFVVDAEAYADLSQAGESDDLAHTVSYVDLHSVVRRVMCGPPRQLVESCAHDIAQEVLQQFPLVSGVRVRVRKPHVAIDGVLEALGVEVYRCRP